MTELIGIRIVLSIVLFLVGVYLLVCGIITKGFIYMNDAMERSDYYPKYVKAVRLFCFILFLVFTVNLAVNCLSYIPEYILSTKEALTQTEYENTLASAKKLYEEASLTLGLSVASVITMLFATTYMTAKYGKPKSEKLDKNHPAFRKKGE